MDPKIQEKIYAGVLGKILGVYLGRPVEGWSYQAIQNRFDEVDRYVANELGIPLIVADDDISGTFGFFKAVEDNQYPQQITSEMIGDAWLDYIIEDKTILWWGGLGRSTEHTAYIRLKEGVKAPLSGSRALNGKTLSEQIGAQIFMDAFAMMCPADPEKADYLVRQAARVSHDGLAVEAAAFLGAMEADAFVTKDLDLLIDRNLRFVKDSYLLKVIDDVRTICALHPAWREARAHIDTLYGYDKFNGPCHIVPNHAMVLASLLLAKDDFHRSITIASSAAWDTDCNAGNVGCLNGIRLGLDAIDKTPFLRDEVADRMLVVTSEGGGCVSDAAAQADAIVRAIEQGPKQKRFSFGYRGSFQGFTKCPYERLAGGRLSNPDGKGLEVLLLEGKKPFSFSTPTFLDFNELAKNFSTIASPTLYEGQTVQMEVAACSDGIVVQPYLLSYTKEQAVHRTDLETLALEKGMQTLRFEIPCFGGMPIFRFGLIATADHDDASFCIHSLDWSNTPKRFAQEGMMLASIWETRPYWFQSWVGSAKQFAADFLHTFCISHPEVGGVVTIGTQDWTDYRLTTNLLFSLHERAGIVVRAKGLRRHYALRFCNEKTCELILTAKGKTTVLAKVDFPYTQDCLYTVVCEVKGERLRVWVDSLLILEAFDGSLDRGAAGLCIDRGSMVARDFILERC